MAPALWFLMKETQRPAREATSFKSSLPWLVALPLAVVFWLALDYIGKLPGGGSVGAPIAPWLGGVLGLLCAYMIVHRGVLFGGGRASASGLLWLTFFPTLLILYLVLNKLTELVGGKIAPDDAAIVALRGVVGEKLNAASFANVMFNVFSVVGALAFGPLVDRFGLRWPLAAGFLALVGVVYALGTATGFWPVMILSGALGFFLLGCNYALYGAAAAYYPPEMRGRGSGASIAWGRLGSVGGPLLGGYLLQAKATPADVFNWMIPFALVAAVGVVLLSTVKSRG
jgi:AAHS family 3-hydroxyphenylpropionic acid transporter